MMDTYEAARAMGGKLVGKNTHFLRVSTDTRTITPGALFVPIVGPNFDAHAFFNEATAKGAAACLCNLGKPPPTSLPTIHVPCTTDALVALAAHYRRKFRLRVCAVTGSAGKTTTTQMIHSILSKRYKTRKTIKNYNNAIGMPLSVFELNTQDEMLVLELGMNHACEISPLARAAAPDVAVITNIGYAHIENFADQTGILHAKLEILDGLAPGGTCIFPGDDPMLTCEIATARAKPFKRLLPKKANITRQTQTETGMDVEFHWEGITHNFSLPLFGKHMAKNAILAAVCALEMGAWPCDIAPGLAQVELPGGRQKIHRSGGITIIDDTYNASPDAMLVALDVLRDFPNTKKRIAILGDMYELGIHAEHLHKKIGQAAAHAADMLVAVGPNSAHMAESFRAEKSPPKQCHHFHTVEEFLAGWGVGLADGDVVLVKAARGMRFERVVEGLLGD